MVIEPGLIGASLTAAASIAALLAAPQDGPGWKKIFNRLRLGKGGAAGGSAITDPAVKRAPSDEWQQTAKTLESQGRYREAARIFQTQGQNYEAARLLLKSGALTEAASAFERVGHFQKAAEVCAQAGDNKRAAENYRNYLKIASEVSPEPVPPPITPSSFTIAVSPDRPSSGRVYSNRLPRFSSEESTGNRRAPST